MNLSILLRDPSRSDWLCFEQPVDIVQAVAMEDVLPALRSVERRVQAEGLHAAGYVAYEAAGGFDPALRTRTASAQPLLAFGLYTRPSVRAVPDEPDRSPQADPAWDIDVAKSAYLRNIAQIHEQIAAGNTYQVNYTIRALAERVSDPRALFRRIAIDAPYAACIESDDVAVVSASPELFFRLEEDTLLCRPMKGTAKRGLTLDDDRRLRQALLDSAKDRAENVMIADMIRNDMGRIAEPGSVIADELYRIEKYRTVWQMISTIRARTNAGVADIFTALFPCASVTGAPKVSSMRIISRLEESPRQVYTGAIGFIAPGRRAQFSVAIRTALIDRRTERAVYGMGGGIVWDSDADGEHEECLAKARILQRRVPSRFELLETLLWTRDEGYFLRDAHLRRLRASAEYFDFDFAEPATLQALKDSAADFAADRMRVRLLLSEAGCLRVEASVIERDDTISPLEIRLASQPVDVDDPFLYHKTTWRRPYERALEGAAPCADVLLWNPDGYVTETTIANVAVCYDGTWCTPPVSCGLLAGTFREVLLARGEIRERRIHVSELAEGTELVLFNAVRGRYEGRLVATPDRIVTSLARESA